MFLNSELHENTAYLIDWLRVVREGGGEGKQRVKEKNEVKTTGSTKKISEECLIVVSHHNQKINHGE